MSLGPKIGALWGGAGGHFVGWGPALLVRDLTDRKLFRPKLGPTGEFSVFFFGSSEPCSRCATFRHFALSTFWPPAAAIRNLLVLGGLEDLEKFDGRPGPKTGQKHRKKWISRSWGPFLAKRPPNKFDCMLNVGAVNPGWGPMCPLGSEIRALCGGLGAISFWGGAGGGVFGPLGAHQNRVCIVQLFRSQHSGLCLSFPPGNRALLVFVGWGPVLFGWGPGLPVRDPINKKKSDPIFFFVAVSKNVFSKQFFCFFSPWCIL